MDVLLREEAGSRQMFNTRLLSTAQRLASIIAGTHQSRSDCLNDAHRRGQTEQEGMESDVDFFNAQHRSSRNPS
jgi:hypothetical protein